MYAVGFPGNYKNNNYKNDSNLKITNGVISGQQFGKYQMIQQLIRVIQEINYLKIK